MAKPPKKNAKGRPVTGDALLRSDIQLTADNKAPTRVRLLAKGLNYTDRAAGDYDAGPFLFDDLAAAMVMANFEAEAAASPSRRRLLIDWNHGMLDPKADRTRGASAGSWVPLLENGDLFADDIQWNETGRSDVEGKLWTTLSPALKFRWDDAGNCRPEKVVNFALVNMAGLIEAQALLAASAAINREGDTAMEEKLEKELRDQIRTQGERIQALETENKALRGASSDIAALRSAIGAPADGPVAASVSMVTGLVALRGEVFKATGTDTAEGAVAALKSIKDKADRTDALEAERETERVAALRSELDGIWKAADDEKQLSPAERTEMEASLLAVSGGKVTREVVAAARGYVAKLGAKVTPEGGGHTPPKSADNNGALTAEETGAVKSWGLNPEVAARAKKHMEAQQQAAR